MVSMSGDNPLNRQSRLWQTCSDNFTAKIRQPLSFFTISQKLENILNTQASSQNQRHLLFHPICVAYIIKHIITSKSNVSSKQLQIKHNRERVGWGNDMGSGAGWTGLQSTPETCFAALWFWKSISLWGTQLSHLKI